MRVLIKNGIVVNADGQAKQDLLIESGIVRQLGTDISPQLLAKKLMPLAVTFSWRRGCPYAFQY